MKQFTINSNDQGQRLDKFLTKLMPNLPNAMLYKSLRKDCVKINGKHVKDAAYKLKEGEIVNLYFKDEFFEAPSYSDEFVKIKPNLNILYEDKNLLLIDKPQGICVHEDTNQNPDNLLNHIKSYLYKKGEYNPNLENTFSPSLANRIDRGTGGIVIAAKNAETLRIINEKIKNKEVKKYYLCLAGGIFENKTGEIKGYLLRDEKTKTVTVFDSPQANAKEILTLYKVVEEFPMHSLVEAELKTGRTHQIRASFAHISHPLLGDRKYGDSNINKRFNYTYQALYAYKLRFEFLEDAGILEYLNHKEFKVENVSFMQNKKGSN